MHGIRRLRRDAPPLLLVAVYVALQALTLAVVALPGGYELEPSAPVLAIQLVLVVLVARGSYLAWMLLLAWEVFGVALMLAIPWLLPATPADLLPGAVLIASGLLSLWFLWSPGLRAHVGDREPSARPTTA